MESFEDELWAEIRKEVGIHCVRHRDLRKANENFQMSLQYQPNKLDSVFHLTNSQAREANLNDALKLLNEKSGLVEYKQHFRCNLQECDCNYEKNNFERGLLMISDKSRHYQNAMVEIPHNTKNMKKHLDEVKMKGPKVSVLQNRFDMVRENFEDMIGKNAGNCLYNQRRYFDKIMHLWDPSDKPKPEAPKPKVLEKTADCDVISLHEENILYKTVKEEYRLEQLSRKFAQCYMGSAWKDFVFAKSLKTNQILCESTQNKKNFDAINKEIDDCLETTNTLISQLHARCPLYTYTRKMYPDPKQKEKANKVSKFRMQNQTRLDMFAALDEMVKCRANGKLKKLIKIAEHELGYHYQIKSDKLMPRKNEFSTEICNLIGLAHLDQLALPQNQANFDCFELLAAILGISFKDKYAVVPYVFGEQKTYRDPGEPDTSFLDFKQNVNRLEKRLKQASLAIEKCHLYHEMGKQNLRQSKFEETRNFARKMIEEARRADSYLWEFLACLLICRANVKQKNFIGINDSLKSAMNLVHSFANPALKNIISTALMISEELL